MYKTLKGELFSASKRKQYSELKIKKENINQTIFSHPEFVTFSKEMDALFAGWKIRNTKFLKELTVGIKPKQTIHNISEDVLKTYTNKKLMDKYDVYQHLMNYWNEIMQDDCYLIAVDGWKAEPYRLLVKNKAGKEVDKGWDCDLVPKSILINTYYLKEKQEIEKQEAQLEIYAAALTELEEDNGEGGVFEDFEKVNKLAVQKRLKELESKVKKVTRKKMAYAMVAEPDVEYEIEDKEKSILKQYLKIADDYLDLSSIVKNAKTELDIKALARYKTLTEAEIKKLVVDDKWMASIERNVKTEMDRISQRLTQRIKELAERYETTLSVLANDVIDWEQKVNGHLVKMGFTL